MHTTQRLKKRQYHAPLLNLINLRGRDPLALDGDDDTGGGTPIVDYSKQNPEGETRRKERLKTSGNDLWGNTGTGKLWK